MKKFLKILLVLIAIGAIVAAVLLYLRKCDQDCSDCDCDCDFDDEDDFEPREYSSIQPKTEESEPAEEPA